MENDNWVNPEDISFSWIKIKCFNEDSSLNCDECEGPIDLDDGFKVAFACVYDFLFWEELLNEEGCVSDLAMKLIDYRYRGYTQES